ncbi:MAG: hypothetical protein Q8L35_07420 [Actinomycetota bacterium]|nr:hypothetical protein [Actinomycetota bacterium]
MEDAEFVRGQIEARLAEPYDKSTVDLNTVANVIYVAAGQEYLWETFGLSVRAPERALRAKFVDLALEEQRQGDVISCLYDRDETALEKIVAMQSAYITRLAEFYLTERDNDIKTAFEYILGDHSAHFSRLARKLSQKEGLSPLARTDFDERGGRPIDLQFVRIKDCFKRPYDREETDPATKVRVRLALAQELAQRRAYKELATVSGDNHLIILDQQACIIDNLHIAMVQSLIDAGETVLESAYLAELSQVVNLERAVKTTPPGNIRDVFVRFLEEERRHLAAIGDMLVEYEGWSGPQTDAWPVLKTANDVAAIVAKISDSSQKLVSKADGWRRAA